MGSAYSYARARAVRAMSATDPRFADTCATGCLWDCEAVTRTEGGRWAPLSAVALRRMREPAADPYEDEEVRDASGRRLGDL